MNKLTIPKAKKYITENYGQARHDISCLVRACRDIAKAEGRDALDIFFLMIENRDIGGTHSYGFHTATGRHLIDSTGNRYYELKNR